MRQSADMPLLRFLFVLALCCLALPGQRQLTSPKDSFGHNVGDDYFLATYTQYETYIKQLASESDRVRLVDMGRTEEGRIQYM
ncbi:MAG: hypothetical protein ACK6DZ_16075, partial [Acidobacteriota bacterium]